MLLHYGLYTLNLRRKKKRMNSNHNYKRCIINCIPHSLSPLAIVAFILQLHLNFYNVFGLRIVESSLLPLH